MCQTKSLPAAAALLVLTLLAPGCAALSSGPTWPRPGQGESRSKGGDPGAAASQNAASLVEEALKKQGLAFGTDGSVEALYSYLRARHQVVPAREARVGDIVFFNTRDEKEHCGSHAGLVDGVRPGGALVFREYRAGRVRRSLVDPGRPATRRDGNGRIINTFLRAKTPDDPEGTRYFAGEMLCAIARVTATR